MKEAWTPVADQMARAADPIGAAVESSLIVLA